MSPSSSVILTVLNCCWSWRKVSRVFGLYRSSRIFHISAGLLVPSTYVITEGDIDDRMSFLAFFAFRIHASNVVLKSARAVLGDSEVEVSEVASGIVGALGCSSVPLTGGGGKPGVGGHGGVGFVCGGVGVFEVGPGSGGGLGCSCGALGGGGGKPGVWGHASVGLVCWMVGTVYREWSFFRKQ